MPPQTPNNEVVANAVTDNPVSTTTETRKCTAWYSPLCQVTKTSKILAAIIFIAMPFVGGSVGWKYGFKSGLNTHTTWNLPEGTRIDASQYNSEELARLLKVKEDFDLKLLQEKLQKEVESYIGTTTVSADASLEKTYFDLGWLVYQPSGDSKNLVSEQVRYTDEQAAKAASKPYLSFVTQIGSKVILTLGCFKFTECTFSGLYKFDTSTKEFSTMKSGDLYVPMYTGGELSPDKTKIALVPYREYNTLGTEFGYIDLVSDTYHNLSGLDLVGNSRFTLCEMGCSTEMSWLSNTSVIATKFDYDSCDGGNNCLSHYRSEDGTVGDTTRPISSSTKRFDL